MHNYINLILNSTHSISWTFMSKIQPFNIVLTNENAFLPDPYLGNCKARSQVIVLSLCKVFLQFLMYF